MHDNVKALARRLLDGEQMNLPREGALDRPKDGKSIPDSFVQQLVLLIFCSSYLSHQTVEWCRTVCSSSERPSPFVTGLGCDSTWLERHGGMVSTWFILLPDFIVRTLQNFWCSNPCIQNSHRCQRGKLPSKNLSTRQRRVQIWICLNIFKYLWHVLALERVASLRLNHIESYWIPVELLRNPRLLRGAASSMACWCFGRHAEAVESESKHSRTEISHKIKVKERLMARALRNWNSLNFQTSKTARETEPETIELWKSWTEAKFHTVPSIEARWSKLCELHECRLDAEPELKLHWDTLCQEALHMRRLCFTELVKQRGQLSRTMSIVVLTAHVLDGHKRHGMPWECHGNYNRFRQIERCFKMFYFVTCDSTRALYLV